MILTERELRDFGTGKKSINFSRTVLKSFSALSSKRINIFLSHKHDEKENVKAARNLFEKYEQVHLYVDWLDNDMPQVPTTETAEKLKKKIDRSDKFVFLATNGAIESKWCNWELGLGDAHKYPDNIALLPAEEYIGGYIGNEYLKLYPYIERIGEREFYLCKRDEYGKSNIIESLDGWLLRAQSEP